MATLTPKVSNCICNLINLYSSKRRGAACLIKRGLREKPRKPRAKHAPIVPQFEMGDYEGLSSNDANDVYENDDLGNDDDNNV